MPAAPSATLFGLRIRAALGRHSLLGMFSYADVQIMKGLADGPDLRRFLSDRGWSGFSRSAEGAMLSTAFGWLARRFGWHVAPPVPDRLADFNPHDAALDVALADIARQAYEQSQNL